VASVERRQCVDRLAKQHGHQSAEHAGYGGQQQQQVQIARSEDQQQHGASWQVDRRRERRGWGQARGPAQVDLLPADQRDPQQADGQGREEPCRRACTGRQQCL